MSESPGDPRLFDLFCGAIEKALEYVRLADAGKTHIGTHRNWPELDWHENGLPWIKDSSHEPKNYGDAIQGFYSILFATGSGEPALDFNKEPNFLTLVEYAKTQPRLQTYLMFKEIEEADFGRIRLLGMVADVLDRYVHINQTTELDRGKLLPVYLPMEKHLFDEVLPVTLVIPILCLKFELEHFDLTDIIAVDKLSEELQLARGWHGPYSSWENSLVESAATHTLFIRDQSLNNENWWADHMTMTPEWYPLEEINTFFAAVRIATGYPTGYAQMLTLPVGWASSYVANLIPIDGPTLESYPPFFKKGYWGNEVPTVSAPEADTVRDTFKGLHQVLSTKHAQKVRLAMHRLNLSAIRSTDEDGVIDAMIAMEALLSDSPQEMTHKVAMRLGGLYKVADRSRAERAFVEMKRIYKFRSKIVHGDADLDRYREIDRDGVTISAIDAAVEHLRNAFEVLIKHPTLLDPKKIDSVLLTDKF